MIYNIFYVSLLEKDTTRKKRGDKALPKPKKELEYEAGNNKEYTVKPIINNVVYGQQENNSNQMPGFYYFILWKGYLEE